jgi:uncharacterized protein (DUF2342 family)
MDDASSMIERLGELDPSDPDSLERVLGDPESVLAEHEQSPEQRRLSDELSAFTAVLLGYVQHIADEASAKLFGDTRGLREAWRRRQVGRTTTDRAAELLFGLDVGPGQADRGNAFVNGVLERAGGAGLGRLWSNALNIPTPSEIDAPGLWLERIDL